MKSNDNIVDCMMKRLAFGPIFGCTPCGNFISVSFYPGTNKIRICVGNRPNSFYSLHSSALLNWFYKNRKYLSL